MKKRILSMIITLALVFGCGAMQAFAADAKVTASLPADKKLFHQDMRHFRQLICLEMSIVSQNIR